MLAKYAMIIFIFLGAHGVLRLGSDRSGQPNSSAGVKRPPDSNFPWRADFTDGRFNRKARNGKAEGESVTASKSSQQLLHLRYVNPPPASPTH